MNIKIKIGVLGIFSFLASCSQEEWSEQATPGEGNKIQFTSTLSRSAAFSTKAIGDEKGEVVPLPYINGIYVRKSESKETKTAVFHVKNGNKGTLNEGETASSAKTDTLKWTDLTGIIPFIAYTVPTGVTIAAGDNPDTGTVDFLTGNQKTTDEKDKLDDAPVPPLEVFISAKATANYPQSPSVTLPFHHIVSKLSIRVRDWNNKSITPTSVTFYAIPREWPVEQSKTDSLHIVKTDKKEALTLPFADLETETDNASVTYSLIYLPPLTSALGTDFASAGDFCITYNGKEYYGTLKGITPAGGKVSQQKEGELQAGEHMRITMDLSENFGVGVGPYIVDWNGPDGEETIYGPAHAGIYSLEGLRLFRDAINNGNDIPDSLYTEENGVKTIHLYNSISLPGGFGSIGNEAHPFTGVFDGQGYTVSGISGSTGLFGTVGNNDASSATIRNLRFSGTLSGTADGVALLADTTTNTAIINCHATGNSSVSNTGAQTGGLIGSANTGTTLSGCSFTGTISGTTAGGIAGCFAGVTITDCFVSETGTATASPVKITGSNTGSGTIRNCYSVIRKQVDTPDKIIGYYWKEVTSSADQSAEFPFNGIFSTQINNDETNLFEALKANASTGINWVYVYGKDFPVIKIE